MKNKRQKIQAAAVNNGYIYHIEAAAQPINGVSDVSGIAYSGAAIRQYWSEYPIVIDLAGMEVAPQLPLLYNHTNEPEYRLGEIAAAIDEKTIQITGGVDTATERGKMIADAGKKFNWQLSIGAEILQAEMINDGDPRTVNGRSFAAPFVHVKKSILREVSVVAVGADPETNLKIAACFGINAPAPKQNIAATLQTAENERRAGIVAACGNDYATFANQAISEGYTVTETNRIVAALKAQAGKLPAAGVNVIVPNVPQTTAQILEAALCFNQGISEKTITAAYPEQVVEAGDKMRGLTLQGLLAECIKIERNNKPSTMDNDAIRAAFSTVSLPSILSNVANKKALQAFTAQPIIATRLCRAGDLNDFKESERYRLTDVGDLEKVADGGEIKHGGVSEDKATNKLDTYGKIFVLTRQMIYNDDLNAFLAIPQAMGLRAARKIDQLFHARLLENAVMSDGNALFSSAHNNNLTGTASELSLAALKAARTKFLKAKDGDGMPINVVPKFLFVPSELDALANELVMSQTVIGGSSVTPAFNLISRFGLEVISSPYLESESFTGNSLTGWYLFGDPAQIDTFEIGYLQGHRVPQVEQGNIDFNTLGMGFRVVFDLGVREQAYQGMIRSTGVSD